MGHAGASRSLVGQDKAAGEITGPATWWRVGVTGLAGAVLIAAAIVAFSSAQTDARPAYVTKSKPCGSCHPPNNPPKRK